MITQETAGKIWECYREIEVAKELLADMAKAREKEPDRDAKEATLRDAFGRRRHLQLGVPSGHNGHTLFQVRPELAESVIRAHIANKTAELAEANEQARIELDMSGTEPCE